MLPEDLTKGAVTLPYIIFRWGDLGDQEELARRLFAGLRELDAAGQPSSFAHCRKTRGSALPFATVCSKLPVDAYTRLFSAALYKYLMPAL